LNDESDSSDDMKENQPPVPNLKTSRSQSKKATPSKSLSLARNKQQYTPGVPIRPSKKKAGSTQSVGSDPAFAEYLKASTMSMQVTAKESKQRMDILEKKSDQQVVNMRMQVLRETIADPHIDEETRETAKSALRKCILSL
jgi:hypothetical protein